MLYYWDAMTLAMQRLDIGVGTYCKLGLQVDDCFGVSCAQFSKLYNINVLQELIRNPRSNRQMKCNLGTRLVMIRAYKQIRWCFESVQRIDNM